MRKIKITIMLSAFFFLFFCSQKEGIAQEVKAQYAVVNELKPYVDDFIKEAEKRDLKVGELFNQRLDSVSVDYELKYPSLGYYFLFNKVVFVSGDMIKDPEVCRTAVFHELSHVLLRDTDYACSRCFNLNFVDTPMKEEDVFPEEFITHLKKNYGMQNLDSLFDVIKTEVESQ